MIKSLYYQTYYAYLKGDLEKTRMFFEILKEEFKSRKDQEALNRYQLKELKSIRSAILSGCIPTNVWIKEEDTPHIVDNEEVFIKQSVLIKRVHYEALDALKSCLGSDTTLYLYNLEHPCGSFGKIDAVYQDEDTLYPIEVKTQEGKHDLLGQISKYVLYFRLLLHLQHFKNVQPVTLCRSYNTHTLAELKRMAVITLKYSLSDKKIKIDRV